MSDRIDINELQPEAYRAMFGLEKYLGATELEPSLKELIKVRAEDLVHVKQFLSVCLGKPRLFPSSDMPVFISCDLLPMDLRFGFDAPLR